MQSNTETKKSTAFSIRDILGPQQQQQQEQQQQQQKQQQQQDFKEQQEEDPKEAKVRTSPGQAVDQVYLSGSPGESEPVSVKGESLEPVCEQKKEPEDGNFSTEARDVNKCLDHRASLSGVKSPPVGNPTSPPASGIHAEKGKNEHVDLSMKASQSPNSQRYPYHQQQQQQLQQQRQELCQRYQHQYPFLSDAHAHPQHLRHLPQLQQNAHPQHPSHEHFYNHNHSDQPHQPLKLCYNRDHLPNLRPNSGDVVLKSSEHSRPLAVLPLASPPAAHGAPPGDITGSDSDRANNNNLSLKPDHRITDRGRFDDRRSFVDGVGPTDVSDSGLSNLSRMDPRFVDSMRFNPGRLDPRLDGPVMSPWRGGCSPIEHHVGSSPGSALLNYNLFSESQTTRDMYGCNGKYPT